MLRTPNHPRGFARKKVEMQAPDAASVVLDPADQARVERAEAIAQRMDNAFRIPGTRITFGWDSVIGLVPGIGDALAMAPAAYILKLAHECGAPRHLLGRMCFNVGVDWVTGLIPILGDLLDLGYKANLRNAKILRAHLEARAVAGQPQAPARRRFGVLPAG